jgi:hypothetical protein
MTPDVALPGNGAHAGTRRARRFAATALPIVAIALFVGSIGLSVWASSNAGTLGYDYLSYDKAIRRFLAGGPLYDAAFNAPGPFGLFFYPPTFVPFILSLALLTPSQAVWAVTALMTACVLAAVALMPVRPSVRWAVLALGAVSWPVVDSIKLGQVGTLLLLLFVIGWRWVDRPISLGLATAVGTAIKLQPALLLGWALLTGRRAAVVVGLVAMAALAAVATIIVGRQAWLDEAALLTRLSQPVTAPHVVTAGRAALEAGLSPSLAWVVQLADWFAIAALTAFAIFRRSAVGSYLAVVIASQALSPILWDHYAVMLLLPVAWLLDRGWWWAAVIPLGMALPLGAAAITPIATYPIAYLAALIAVVAADRGPLAAPAATAPTT